MLVIQILTGIFLAMHYTPHIDLAFNSVEHIMRDVNNGWLIRYTHANGASFFFIVVYIYIFRGLYYGSYITSREYVWCIKIIFIIKKLFFVFFVLFSLPVLVSNYPKIFLFLFISLSIIMVFNSYRIIKLSDNWNGRR